MIRCMIRSIILLSSFFIAFYAVAHQQKQAITTILFNDRTENIEIMHRFYVHDAEHAVSQLFDAKGVDIHNNEETQKAFIKYLWKHFYLNDQDDQALPLTLVGYETDNRHFWLYQEAPIPSDLTGFKIKFNALRDVWNEQTNLINIEGRGKVKSLIFAGEQQWQSVDLSNAADKQ